MLLLLLGVQNKDSPTFWEGEGVRAFFLRVCGQPVVKANKAIRKKKIFNIVGKGGHTPSFSGSIPPFLRFLPF